MSIIKKPSYTNQQRYTNQLLGYPPDARLLIINADDFGLCHAVNAAIFRALTQGIVTSTTLMVTCPWSLHAMRLLAAYPELAFGVHLTVICETLDYKWGPLTPRAEVPSLVDEAGHFYSFERMDEFLAQADLGELEVEFRAQIEAVLDARLQPSHLDWHCLRFGTRTDIFDLMLRLAQEYGLALRVVGQPLIEKVQRTGLPCNDHDFLDSYQLDLSGKSAQYARQLRGLPAGLSEWAVHPGFESDELQTIMPDGWQVRQSDFDFLISPQAREILYEEDITLLDYRALQMVWHNVQQ